jgi:hypothetical protein
MAEQLSPAELLELLAVERGFTLTADATGKRWQAANAAMELATVLCRWAEQAVEEAENTGTLSEHMRGVLREEATRVRERIQFARATT